MATVLARRAGHVGVDLGALRSTLAGPRIRDPTAMIQELLVQDAPVRTLLELVLGVRVYERVRVQHTMSTALAELASPTPSRWVLTAVRQCFGMYCALRRAAVPLSVQSATAELF